MNENKTKRKIPEELVEQIQKGNTVLFIGAGLSIGAGLPGWNALIDPLSNRIGYSNSDPLKAAQYYENRNGRQALVSYLRDQLDTTKIALTENHKLLAHLPINTVYTTNLDDLLERAYRDVGKSHNVIVGTDDLSFWDEARVNIIKLHGSRDRPTSIIITERDFHTIYRSNSLIVQHLNTLLATKTFLLIGYSLNDPDFNQIYDQLEIDLGRNQRRPYLVTFEADEFKLEDLEKRGYFLIRLPSEDNYNESLAKWLLELVNLFTTSTLEKETDTHTPKSHLKTSLSLPSNDSPHSSRKTIQGGYMDYEFGLTLLKEHAENSEWFGEFDRYEQQLRENLLDERRYGPSEQTRRDRARITDQLNMLAREHLDTNFNNLCMGKQPQIKRLDKASDDEIINLLKELKTIVIKTRSEEREIANRLWQTIQQGRIEQGEIANTIDALRRWAKSVQKAGLPIDSETRTAILSLTQPTEGVDGMYNYLHFALPLLPGLLSIESEIDLNKLWGEIKERWGGKPTKGIGDEAPAENFIGSGNRWAVLVGVDQYEDHAHYGRLQVCVKDVEAINEQLVKSGFQNERIRLLTDKTKILPTRDNILVTLKSVADATDPDDLLLFYYSGHGDENESESYLVARNGKMLILEDTAIKISRVKQIMEQAPARAKVIILDACHSGADIKGKGPKQMSEEFIRRVFEEATGLAILASCKQGQVSYEWRENQRSVFTHFLLEALDGQADLEKKGFVTVQDANRYVSNGVKLWASQRSLSQTPTLQVEVAGDIILVRNIE